MKHLYIQTIFTLQSPLAVGSGQAQNTDRDIAIDGRGNPFIPATTLAGIYRSFFTEEEQNQYFGFVEQGKQQKEPKHEQSKVVVYDAVLMDGKTPAVLFRDNVRLDEWKTSVKGAKFDYEALDTGTKLVGFIELDKNAWSQVLEDRLIEILAVINSGGMPLGAKGTRGYGKVEVEARCRSFVFPEQIKDWLEFSPFDNSAWKDISALVLKATNPFQGQTVITLKLALQGGIAIREYVTKLPENEDAKLDYSHIQANGKAVVPGTSWAGAFRHHFAKLGYAVDSPTSLFGYVNPKKKEDAVKSRIRFSESILNGGTWKVITRNAVDRFSAGTKDGALYTEKRYYGGSCYLEIRLKDATKQEKELLGACLSDLHMGLLAVGGLTSVGCGLFQIECFSINGQEKPEFIKNMACLEKLSAADEEQEVTFVPGGVFNGV